MATNYNITVRLEQGKTDATQPRIWESADKSQKREFFSIKYTPMFDVVVSNGRKITKMPTDRKPLYIGVFEGDLRFDYIKEVIADANNYKVVEGDIKLNDTFGDVGTISEALAIHNGLPTSYKVKGTDGNSFELKTVRYFVPEGKEDEDDLFYAAALASIKEEQWVKSVVASEADNVPA